MRRKEGNKEQAILDAAVVVFSNSGFANAKIHEISDKAGIAIGTVYLYFKNKEEILVKIFESVWANLFTMIETIDSNVSDPIEKFHEVIDAVFELFDKKPELATIFVNEHHHIVTRNNRELHSNFKKTLTICENALNQGKKKGVYANEIDPVAFSRFFLGGIRFILQQWALDTKKMSLTVCKKSIKLIVLNGIMKQ
jgi:TetR/AcrR family transcriptional regulator, fatty acid metabolism regulator protein